jgi:hypothetical protein
MLCKTLVVERCGGRSLLAQTVSDAADEHNHQAPVRLRWVVLGGGLPSSERPEQEWIGLRLDNAVPLEPSG